MARQLRAMARLSSSSSLVARVLAVAGTLAAAAFPAADEVHGLPGWRGSLPSRQFSGSIDLMDGCSIRYWLVLAEGNWAKWPLVLWVQGGPGGSSLEGMWLENMGPFAVSRDGETLERSAEGGWSSHGGASMLYWEMPAGVGFSTCGGAKGCPHYDDSKFEAQSTEFLCEFFAKFPDLAALEFFMVGESYGGVYIPLAALGYLDGGCPHKQPKLVGVAVGNGCTGTEAGPCGPDRAKNTFRESADHGFVAPETVQVVDHACAETPGYVAANEPCRAALEKASKEAGKYNTYDAHDSCSQDMTLLKFICDETPNATWACDHDDEAAPPPVDDAADCGAEDRTTAYLSRADVQAAIHVAPRGGGPVAWGAASINYTRSAADLLVPSGRSYPALIQRVDRVLIYSGDFDAQVPHGGTEAWTRGLGLKPVEAWRPWSVDGVVAGNVVQYEKNFSFVTVRGAGHLVPKYQPHAAINLLRRFLRGHAY